MQNEIFTFGIGKVIASGYAMRNCIEFLKTAYLKPLAWIKENGIKYGKVIYINYEPRDQWMENLANEIDSVSTWILSKDFKYCFSGYNQFIVYRTKAEAKRYLKVNSSIHRIKDLLTITDELRQKITATSPREVYEVTDGYAFPIQLEIGCDDYTEKIDMRTEQEIKDALWNDDDSAEVADEKHYAEMSKFFDENVMDMAFSSYLPFCSRCGKSKPDYVGMMKFADKTQMPITFAFCVTCRDTLVQLQIQRTQSPERFGV